MSSAHSKANAKRWAGMKPEERTRRMTSLANKRWAKVPATARKRISAKLIRARNQKRNGD